MLQSESRASRAQPESVPDKEVHWPQPEPRLLLLAVLVGVLGALGALGFEFGLHWVRAQAALLVEAVSRMSLPGNRYAIDGGTMRLWLPPLMTAFGLLAAAQVSQRLLPSQTGHGTDRIIQTYHQHRGVMPRRSGVVVGVAAMLTIAGGGSAGREAPASLIGGAAGSHVGRWLRLPPRHQRWLLLMGVAAGFGAMFKTRIGAAMFAIGLLYRGLAFESEALMYTVVSAVVAYVLAGWFGDWHPLFWETAGLEMTEPMLFLWVAVFAMIAGGFAALMPSAYYGIGAVMARIPGPGSLRPLLGGLAVGGLVLAVPQVAGSGVGEIQAVLAAGLPAWYLLSAAGLKLVATSLTLRSGGVGGILAPSLFIGAMLGAGFAQALALPVDSFALVGMAAIFSAAARVPVATLLMVPELTGQYQLLPPTALAVAVAYLVQIVLARRLRYASLHLSQPSSMLESPAHADEVLIAGLSVLKRGGIRLPAEIDLPDLRALLSIGYPVRLGPGGLVMVRANVPAGSPICRDRLAEQPLGSGVWLLEIRRAGQVEVPGPDSRLQADDQLAVVVDVSQLTELASKLSFPPVLENWLARHEPVVYQRFLARRQADTPDRGNA